MPKKAAEINPLAGERIKTLLRERGKTAKWLAGQMHVSEVHLSNIVRGKKRLTDFNAKRIIELFPDIRYEWIMGVDDMPTKEKSTISELCDTIKALIRELEKGREA